MKCRLFGHKWVIAMGVNCKVFADYCTHYKCKRCGEKKIERKEWGEKNEVS